MSAIAGKHRSIRNNLIKSRLVAKISREKREVFRHFHKGFRGKAFLLLRLSASSFLRPNNKEYHNYIIDPQVRWKGFYADFNKRKGLKLVYLLNWKPFLVPNFGLVLGIGGSLQFKSSFIVNVKYKMRR